MTGGIAVYNVSTLLSQADAKTMVDAVAIQIVRDVAPDWSRLPCPPIYFSTEAEIPAGMPRLAIVDASDQANALGYHTIDNGGNITGIVAVKPVLDAGGSALVGPWSVASVLSHEVIEAMIDPFCCSLSETNDGHRWPIEPGDACEGASYEINGVSVSNYSLPNFFNPMPAPGAKFDKLGVLPGPFTLSATGGYADIEDPSGKVTQIGGARPAYRPESEFSRTRRRRDRKAKAAA